MTRLAAILVAGLLTFGITLAQPAQAEDGWATAVFAGGCFWCMEPPFDALPGVIDTTSGYAGGMMAAPTYKQVSAGGTGHFEVVRVTYDPTRVSYSQLLDVFWRNIDPFDDRGQFCDKGTQYRAAIFVASPVEREAAERSKAAATQRLGRAPVTEILPAAPFYAAEDYHQDYYLTNPLRYKYYRWNCGRDARLEAVWGASPSH